MRRRVDPRQLTFDWTAAALPAAAAPAVTIQPPPAVPQFAPSEPVQILPWDFRTTFPPVLEDAIDAGVIAEEDAIPDNLAALHAEHEAPLNAALSDLKVMQDARRRGVDPITGKAPRTPKKKSELPARLDQEVKRLERWWETLLETYEAAFGPDAAEAFGKSIRARHAGIEVTADRRPRPPPPAPELPIPKPLRRSVKAGVFGHEEDGPVDPSPEEVREITENHADALTELVGQFRSAGRHADSQPAADAVQAAVRKYADDFGEKAAGSLLAYCRRRAALNGLATVCPRPHP